jgi:hypothetical protein
LHPAAACGMLQPANCKAHFRRGLAVAWILPRFGFEEADPIRIMRVARALSARRNQMRRIVVELWLACVVSLTSAAAYSATITFSIVDILSPSIYEIVNSGQTYAGTGFVGQYDNDPGESFAHVFGLEGSYSRTNMQVGISALAGATVNSATLSFVLAENFVAGNHLLTITSYDASGALEYLFGPPTAAYGAVTGGFVEGDGALQTYDVTSILISAVAAGEDWLGLHLYNSDGGRWTYTCSDLTPAYSCDRAQVRLAIDYTPAGTKVPEPATLALIGLGLAGLGFLRRRPR